jgi:TnpA family transposase
MCQSTVAFAFCRLLGFQLLPRLKAIHSQKLYRPEIGKANAYANLQLIPSKTIDWELVRGARNPDGRTKKQLSRKLLPLIFVCRGAEVSDAQHDRTIQ